jgi:putative thiamine transport system permease protein
VGAPLRQGLTSAAGLAPGALLYAAPIVLALPVALWQGMSATAWLALAQDTLLPRALVLSVSTALVSTLVSLALALWLVTHLHAGRAWGRLVHALAPLLAVPHAAFAIGLALLVMPAGLLARLLAPLFGWASPPDWPTQNDPHGLALMVVLVAKETPFLLWNMVALLARPELAAPLRGWLASGRTLGYADAAVWWRVLWPLLLPRLAWPVLAVLAYGLTVVDLALIAGPASPPTLAVLAWQALKDGDPARNAEGAAMALLLGLALLGLVLAGVLIARAFALPARRRAVNGRRTTAGATPGPAHPALHTLLLLYALVGALLLASSFTGVWTFPALLPQRWTGAAWQQVATSADTLVLSAALGLVAAFGALAVVLLWFEFTPPQADTRVMPLVLAPLVIPPLLLLVGLYRLALPLRLDGTFAGLAWVHLLAALPYVFVALAPAWRAYDRRYEHTALALGRSRAAFWWRVKRPMLAAPIAAALAVGFAVSVAQYLPTQFIGAGRLATVTTEAVTLAAGGQRHAAAAFAALQALLPLFGFALAAALGRAQGRRIAGHARA